MSVTFLNLLILVLASFRLTRLLVFDKITEFLRQPFFDEVEEENEDGVKEVYYIPKKKGIKKFIGELLSCYWCTGMWTSGVIVFSVYLIPKVYILIIVLAVAGFAAILETLVQYLIEK